MHQDSFSLAEIAHAVKGRIVPAAMENLRVFSLNASSKSVAPSSLYIAIRGTKVDGHAFLQEAFENGAAAAVVSDGTALQGKPGVVVSDTRCAYSRLGSLFAGDPSRALKVVGITGTNGKTTIHWLVFHALQALGTPAMRIGTIGFEAPGISEEGVLTTPDPPQQHQLMLRGYNAGGRALTIEVSSHALHQHRADDIAFDVGVFTNLTRDHLDYHQTMENYFLAKRALFDLIANGIKSTKGAVINYDDEYGLRYAAYAEELGLRLITYGKHAHAAIRIDKFTQNVSGSTIELEYKGARHRASYRAIGMHNAYNFCAALGALLALGYDISPAVAELEKIPAVPGRLEPVGNERLGIYVDYAHTPDALENVLRTVKELAQHDVWVVFGCGGDRDRGKRPIMAQIAAKYANKVVVTSDNPRTEDPHAIIRDILATGTRADYVESDRREAICIAVREARDGDVILIAGKGHEDYQIIGTEKRHFSDQEEARKALAARRS